MIVPGNIDSPQRSRSHPGEHPMERKPVNSVLSAYLYLLGQDSQDIAGQIFEL